VWDGETGKKLIELIGHKGWVYSAAFCNEGKRIVTASQDTTACVWDAATGEKLFELSRQKGWVFSAVFSPKGDGLLTASEDKFARIYCDELCCSLETLYLRAKFVRHLTAAEKEKYLH
jgi:WD40 repeat protein